ncbi:preprotein translocase subunit SecE [Kitasatospora sp. NBC_01287]|uniref:preprotein translocase subunit SecE n=1 Tax=Kitasatospora sp. NBC_01287 TaxID=2903573 RepID=UPI00224F9E62|nr:preprotein translocase subunit SecE [Kitasatospora sp. NBC_01287]MCX4751372.1 preprotein translocase subunit SecE [Kitasatospora sp. NBC_01287]
MAGPTTRDRGKAPSSKPRGVRGLLARLSLFYRQIVAELRKVVWPTRSELTSYTGVVLSFVTVMIMLVYGLDTAFAHLSFAIFG